jgi:GT2 family glycosyltransferase
VGHSEYGKLERVRIVEDKRKRVSGSEAGRLLERVASIQAELADLQHELAAVPNGRHRAGYWNAVRDYWARLRRPVKLYCDEPAHGLHVRLGEIVSIKGWAVGQAGISLVEIQIDDHPPIAVPHDLNRPDVRDAFPAIPSAESSGFLFEWDTRGYRAGQHEILIRTRTCDGARSQIRRQIELANLSDFQILCDDPRGTVDGTSNASMRIRGWYAGKSPVRQIEFNIDDGPTRELSYGWPRPDVHEHHPECLVKCGFQGETPSLLPGVHQITIVAKTRGGDSAVLKQVFFVRHMEDDVRLCCDYPVTNACQSVRDVVEFRGWAAAWSGIQQVTIQIGDRAPLMASFGIPRPDVAEALPDFPSANRSGWRLFWDTTGLPEVRYDVRITATSLSGSTSTVTTALVVDHGCDPEYSRWIVMNEPTPERKKEMAKEIASFERRPRISIVVPVYKTPRKVLASCIDSVLAQIYPDWELCLADDGSNDAELTGLLEQYCERDRRIRMTTLAQNLGIPGATNAALGLSTGDYIGFLDHDDELADFALWEMVKAINDVPQTDLFYSDEDKIDESGRRYDWFFKPEWSPELFLSCNYLCHFIVVRRWVIDRVGGLNEKYKGGSQDYDFLLRAIECTSRIKRIPKILYHWRALRGSTAKASQEKPAAGLDGQLALSDYLSRNQPGATVEEVFPCHYRVHYPIEGSPRVDIIMPTGGKMDLLRRAVEDVIDRTTYKNFEIVLVDNSTKDNVKQYFTTLDSNGAPVRYIDWRNKRFNFSLMNNEAVRRSTAPYVLFLNDDMSIVTEEWLSAMLEHAQRPHVGAVGAQLWYPHDTIQHAGVVMGIFDNTAHAFRHVPVAPPGRSAYFDFPWMTRNCIAVTAACLLISQSAFWNVNGFNEKDLAVAFQDVDLCLKLVEHGYRNIYTPYAILYHYESATKAEVRPNPVEDHFMKRKWKGYILDDPYYSPNLTRRGEQYQLRLGD